MSTHSLTHSHSFIHSEMLGVFGRSFVPGSRVGARGLLMRVGVRGVSSLAAVGRTPTLQLTSGNSSSSSSVGGWKNTALRTPSLVQIQTPQFARCFSGGSMQGTANDVNAWQPAANRSHWLFGRVGLAVSVLMFTGWSLYLLSTRGREQPTPPIAAALNIIYQVPELAQLLLDDSDDSKVDRGFYNSYERAAGACVYICVFVFMMHFVLLL
jgi:hypothetical protein